METPISSHVKDKNSIFTARDEDMIFLVKGKILVFHQYLCNKSQFTAIHTNQITIIYRNTCQIKRQPCQIDRPTPVIASTAVITTKSNSIYLLSLIIIFGKLTQPFTKSIFALLIGCCCSVPVWKFKTVSFLTQGKVHESFLKICTYKSFYTQKLLVENKKKSLFEIIRDDLYGVTVVRKRFHLIGKTIGFRSKIPKFKWRFFVP